MRQAFLVVVLLLTCLVAPPAAAKDDDETVAVLTVLVRPAQAQIFVDGERYPTSGLGEPLRLTPGRHRIEARLEGYEPKWREVEVEAGRDNAALELKLVAKEGTLVVETYGDGGAVRIDGKEVGFNGWEGLVESGIRRVEVELPSGRSESVDVLVIPGEVSHVIQETNGHLHTDRPPREGSGTSAPTYKPPWTDVPATGPYILATGTLLIPGSDAKEHERGDGLSGGPGGGTRLGWRVHPLFGAELLLHVSYLDVDGALPFQETSWDLLSTRVGVAGRLMYPEDTSVRLDVVAGVGGVVQILHWRPEVPNTEYQDLTGGGIFGQFDIGMGLEFEGWLAHFGAQLGLESTFGLDADVGRSSIEGVIWSLGPQAMLGYGFFQ